jgi:DNA replication protein DnaC
MQKFIQESIAAVALLLAASTVSAETNAEQGTFLGDDAKWLPEYDEIVDWLSDNRGRGLLLIGTSGLGKSLICQKILPVLLGEVVDVVNAREMGQVLDVLLQRRCVIIDNLGSEPVSEMVNYRKRRPFFELCDAAEQRGLLLIINTTLSTTRVRNPLYPQSIQERYGNEVLDRLRATTRVVELRGKSMRK